MFSELPQNRKKKPATILKKQQNKVEEKRKEISSKLMKNEQISLVRQQFYTTAQK
jgi:predicted thioredoxin/glutaredoxin